MNDVETVRKQLLPRIYAALDFVGRQARRTVDTYPGYSPMYTVGGKWNREGQRWTHWCEGFFPGILWLLHSHTGEAGWRQLAEQYSKPLEPRRFDRDVHDLGFLFFSTYLRWFRLTGDPALEKIILEAGRTLALRRQKGGYLASFLGPHSLFIDIMMNVGIILWTANATGDEALREIAIEHCRTTAKYIIRADGGSAHEGIFDVESGKFVRESTQQGLRADSTWSRGQAWALYGFTAMHRLGGGAEFLETAHRCADFYLKHAPNGAVPLWDFDVPDDGKQPFDSSAAAIAASGLLDLANEVQDQAERDRYRLAALQTLNTLCTDEFLAFNRPEWEGILMHGVYHLHKGLGVDESVAWGEHFFVEALTKATKPLVA
ncbi:MAG TPA: glycoside hydrolase family 88 protein [Gemmataceae bacterium]|nr:glycoside hydrolase family 88 protein [Gemmataceae bacterium]